MSTTAPVIEPVIETFYTQSEAAERYAVTPSWHPSQAPQGYAGSFQLGDGIFRTICRECPTAVDSYGAVPRYATVGTHEVYEHGLQVGGINVGTLA